MLLSGKRETVSFISASTGPAPFLIDGGGKKINVEFNQAKKNSHFKGS
jgi:hypothetical protein